MSAAEPRHDSQPPLFDITGEPVDLEGHHYAEATTAQDLERRGGIR